MALLRRAYYWPQMVDDIAQYVKTCLVSQKDKSDRLMQVGLLEPLAVPKRPWENVSLDFSTGLPMVGDLTTILTERFNGMLEEYLRHFVTESQKNWLKLLDTAQLSFNSQKSSMALVNDGRVRSYPRGCQCGGGGAEGKRSKGATRLRVGSWNIITLTGKSVELAKILEKRKINIACVQETRWVGDKARDVGSFKLWYSGRVGGKNEVGILVDKDLRELVVEVRKVNDMLMTIKLVVGGFSLNIISAYAPEVGLDEEVKRRFWEDLDEMVRVTGQPKTRSCRKLQKHCFAFAVDSLTFAKVYEISSLRVRHDKVVFATVQSTFILHVGEAALANA
uniref:Integrase zinc-binding domain-containing protein n=1 Tax=Nicotiana tabacum TaxID=4097 RepID=A0A1S4C7N6_TOBAC|nr:PREDICTED: uncharacterized protein LOC107815830 [Nicotiana tabacum]